jgi:PRTRC genetic system protein C
MPTLHAEVLLREFYYHDTPLPDPNPAMSVEQVRDLYTHQYPEIATAKIAGPEVVNGALRYTFRRAIGQKG